MNSPGKGDPLDLPEGWENVSLFGPSDPTEPVQEFGSVTEETIRSIQTIKADMLKRIDEVEKAKESAVSKYDDRIDELYMSILGMSEIEDRLRDRLESERA